MRQKLHDLEKRLREVQKYLAATIMPGVSLVDELIAERRAEAQREDAEFRAGREASRTGHGEKMSPTEK